MDKDKQIQKVDKLSLKKLSEDSSLAKRGLRDIGIWPKVQTLLKEIEKQYFAHNYQKCFRQGHLAPSVMGYMRQDIGSDSDR